MTTRGRTAAAEIVRSGALSALLHPLWSVTSVACLVAVLAPLLVGFGLAQGVADLAETSLAEGADVTVIGTRFGRNAPIPESAVDAIRAIPGVTSAEPRVSGPATLGADRIPVVVIGVPESRLGADFAGLVCVEGRLPRAGAVPEVAVGSELARRLSLRAGSAIPPFYRNRAGEKVTVVSGVFASDLPFWQSHLMLTTIGTAREWFDETDDVTSILVRCAPEYRDPVRSAILRIPSLAPAGQPELRPRVTLKDDLASRIARGAAVREGGFAAILGLGVAIGVPVLLVSTGLGLSERRRETGLLRALGWRVDEIVLRSLVESAVLAVAGWSLAILASWVWVRGFGAAGICALFVPDAGTIPALELPFRLAPEAILGAAAGAVALVSAGTLVTAWRAASASPAEAMR